LSGCCTGETEDTKSCNEQKCSTHVESNTGFCTSVTEDECKAIAKARNVRFYEIQNRNLYLFPKGCYYKSTNHRIYFNVMNSKKECNWKRVCICKQVSGTR
jgi:hypothetical protein